MITILQTTRKGLVPHLTNFCKSCGFKHEVFNGLKVPVTMVVDKLAKSKVVVISNGNDKKDLEIIALAKKRNLKCKFLYSEFAWFTWSSNVYLDEAGIGNKSFLYDKPMSYFTEFDQKMYDYYNKDLLTELKVGKDINDEGFIFIPLQIDNDSKIQIGSPNFKTVSQFLNHVVYDYLKDYKGTIYIKKHPNDPREINQIVNIPKDNNIVDISKAGISKYSLITKSKAVMGINTTFMMECIAMNKAPITFGLDIFSNKNLTIDGMKIPFKNIDSFEMSDYMLFTYELMKRQINKSETFNKDLMVNGFWKKKIEEMMK